VSRLQEIFGGNAVSDEYGIGRHVANLFVTQTYEGQSDIHCESTQRSALAKPDPSDRCSSDSRPRNYGHPGVLLMVFRPIKQSACEHSVGVYHRYHKTVSDLVSLYPAVNADVQVVHGRRVQTQ
jgi:hypothetical protein